MNEGLFWLGVNIYHEARGESLEGQIAVGHVVLNRAEKKHRDVKSIVLQPYQFSWRNNNTFPPIGNYEALRKSFVAAYEVLAKRMEGKTLQGADHYFADYIDPPSWADEMTEVVKIGKHTFYRE